VNQYPVVSNGTPLPNLNAPWASIVAGGVTQTSRSFVGPQYDAQGHGDALLRSLPTPVGAVPHDPTPWQYGIVSLHLPLRGFGFIAPAKRPGHRLIGKDIHFYTANVLPKCRPGFRRFLLVRFLAASIRGRSSATQVTTIRAVPQPERAGLVVPLPTIAGVIAGFDPATRVGVVRPSVQGRIVKTAEFPFRVDVAEELLLPPGRQLADLVQLIERATSEGASPLRVRFSVEMAGPGSSLSARAVSLTPEALAGDDESLLRAVASGDSPLSNSSFTHRLIELFGVKTVIGIPSASSLETSQGPTPCRVISANDLLAYRRRLGVRTLRELRVSTVELLPPRTILDQSPAARAAMPVRVGDLAQLKSRPSPGMFLFDVGAGEPNQMLEALDRSCEQYGTAGVQRTAGCLLLLERGLTPVNFHKLFGGECTQVGALKHLRGIHLFPQACFSPDQVPCTLQPVLFIFSSTARPGATLAPVRGHDSAPPPVDAIVVDPDGDASQGSGLVILQVKQGVETRHLTQVLASTPRLSWRMDSSFLPGHTTHAVSLGGDDDAAAFSAALVSAYPSAPPPQMAPLPSLYRAGPSTGALLLGRHADIQVLRLFLQGLGSAWSICTGGNRLAFHMPGDMAPGRCLEAIALFNRQVAASETPDGRRRGSRGGQVSPITHFWDNVRHCWTSTTNQKAIAYSPPLEAAVLSWQCPVRAVAEAVLLGPFHMTMGTSACTRVALALFPDAARSLALLSNPAGRYLRITFDSRAAAIQHLEVARLRTLIVHHRAIEARLDDGSAGALLAQWEAGSPPPPTLPAHSGAPFGPLAPPAAATPPRAGPAFLAQLEAARDTLTHLQMSVPPSMALAVNRGDLPEKTRLTKAQKRRAARDRRRSRAKLNTASTGAPATQRAPRAPVGAALPHANPYAALQLESGAVPAERQSAVPRPSSLEPLEHKYPVEGKYDKARVPLPDSHEKPLPPAGAPAGPSLAANSEPHAMVESPALHATVPWSIAMEATPTCPSPPLAPAQVPSVSVAPSAADPGALAAAQGKEAQPETLRVSPSSSAGWSQATNVDGGSDESALSSLDLHKVPLSPVAAPAPSQLAANLEPQAMPASPSSITDWSQSASAEGGTDEETLSPSSSPPRTPAHPRPLKRLQEAPSTRKKNRKKKRNTPLLTPGDACRLEILASPARGRGSPPPLFRRRRRSLARRPRSQSPPSRKAPPDRSRRSGPVSRPGIVSLLASVRPTPLPPPSSSC